MLNDADQSFPTENKSFLFFGAIKIDEMIRVYKMSVKFQIIFTGIDMFKFGAISFKVYWSLLGEDGIKIKLYSVACIL